MAAPYLALYVVVHKDDAEQMVRVQQLSPRHVSPSWPEIGLRQSPTQALERFEKIFGKHEPSHLVLVEVLFSARGYAKVSFGPLNRGTTGAASEDPEEKRPRLTPEPTADPISGKRPVSDELATSPVIKKPRGNDVCVTPSGPYVQPKSCSDAAAGSQGEGVLASSPADQKLKTDGEEVCGTPSGALATPTPSAQRDAARAAEAAEVARLAGALQRLRVLRGGVALHFFRSL